MNSILFPLAYRLEINYQHLYHEWHEAKVATEPVVKIENVRFEHDPLWNKRLLSIQSARDGNHPVWQITHAIWLGLSGEII